MRWFFGLVLLAGTASADALPDVDLVLSEIQEREVSVTGFLGSGGIHDAKLQTESGTYQIFYALPRDQIKRAEQCELNLFSDENTCRVTAKAEIKIEHTLVKLIVFQIEFLDD